MTHQNGNTTVEEESPRDAFQDLMQLLDNCTQRLDRVEQKLVDVLNENAALRQQNTELTAKLKRSSSCSAMTFDRAHPVDLLVGTSGGGGGNSRRADSFSNFLKLGLASSPAICYNPSR